MFWVGFKKLLRREGSYVRTFGMLYPELLQAVRLYRSEMWVFTAPILKTLDVACMVFSSGVVCMRKKIEEGLMWVR